MKRITLILGMVFILSAVISAAYSSGSIVVGSKATDMERYAALELQRYIHLVTGKLLPVVDDSESSGGGFIVGRASTNRSIADLAKSGKIAVGSADPGPQGYVLKTLNYKGKKALIIAGTDQTGVLYGVYGLLDDYYNVGFYMGGDVIPAKRAFYLPDVDEKKAPQAMVRGFLPWTNFPQSATVYSWEDWKFILDQMAKMRMNFLHIHNYNASGGHNEMFHNFTYKGFLSRVWMPTARTGHGWAGPKWDVNEYKFGAADLFDDYDFGADCTLHNENLNNYDTFRKGATLFQKVIAYAHTRGVRIGLGLDINAIPYDYIKEFKIGADDSEVVDARVDQVVTDYPDLDYLICFQFEGSRHDEKHGDVWTRVFNRMYDGMKKRSPNTRLAVAGWGIEPKAVEALPEDVICAPISAYSAGFDKGSDYGKREYWACPWLERDFNSSEYYYPYNMHLSETIKAWRERSSNTVGLYCLTWRLTDAVDAKMSYVAKAPWDIKDKYNSSKVVYHEYAARNYGAACADEITAIINENEPFACGWGECQVTPNFSGTFTVADGSYMYNLRGFRFRPDAEWVVAADRDAAQGTQNHGTGAEKCVAYIQNGDWIRFDNFDFGEGASVFEVEVASPNKGGAIQVRLDHPVNGPLVSEVKVTTTGSWGNWVKVGAPALNVTGKYKMFITFIGPEINEMPKAQEQLGVINKWMARTTNGEQAIRLNMLRLRIQAAYDHIWLNRYFPSLPWNELPGRFDEWARCFTHRVNDISSLGNVQSTQNRFIQLNYLPRENELRDAMAVKPPAYVEARGTADGAVITWRSSDDKVKGYNIYRSGNKINSAALGADSREYSDKANGIFSYAVTSISADETESVLSVASRCAAGKADRVAPRVIVVSPPVSVAAGQKSGIKARVIDDRAYDYVSASLYYRMTGEHTWKKQTMERRVKSVFTGELPAQKADSPGLEYYVEVTDGRNIATFPANGASAPSSLVVYTIKDIQAPGKPETLVATTIDGKPGIEWKAAQVDVFWYRIYRGRTPDFRPGPANFVTYVYKDVTRYAPNGEDFDGSDLKGDCFYRITAVDKWDNEGAPTPAVKVTH